jgi:hypothetical protein
MVALAEIIAGRHPPYGLFHATPTSPDLLRRYGLRATGEAPALIHQLVSQLSAGLRTKLVARVKNRFTIPDDYYPLEMPLFEQLARGQLNYGGIVFAFERSDVELLALSASEPERRARALRAFAEAHQPELLDELIRNKATQAQEALDLIDSHPADPYVVVRLTDTPPSGFFSLLSTPERHIGGILRSYDRIELRPEARAVFFNGHVPPECIEFV